MSAASTQAALQQRCIRRGINHPDALIHANLQFICHCLCLDHRDFDIDVLISLNVRQAYSELIDIGPDGYGKPGFELKQRCAAHRREICLGLHGFNVDGEFAQDPADLVNNPWVIHAGSSQLAWDKSFCRFFRRWRLDGDGQAGFRFDSSIVARNSRKLAGFSGDENDDGEFAAKCSHLAVFDVATVA